jgi:ferritin-like metal-binding protein YciE
MFSHRETLLTMAQAAGHPEHMPALQLCLSEERGMAAFIAENHRGTGLRFRQLRSKAHRSKR